MQRFEMSWDVDASPEKVWGFLHVPPPPGSTTPRLLEYDNGRMQILMEGDATGQGLVRLCDFRVPRWLGSGGKGRSMEVVTEVRVNEYARYQGVCKPLWAEMSGWHELAQLPSGGTRLTFVENYHALNPFLRALFERRVHRFISSDNRALYGKLLGYVGSVTPVEA
jgi:hypothetical protein